METKELIRQIATLYNRLSPENLSCDGERPAEDQIEIYEECTEALNPLLKQFEAEYGFFPDEGDAYDLDYAFRQSAREGLAMLANKSAKPA